MAYRRTEHVEKLLRDKRERILHAVRAVVSEVGFRGAQVAMVADAAGVAIGTVYQHFPSKAELFAEALGLNARHEIDVMASVVAAEGLAATRLADAIRVFARRAVEARRLAYAMMAEPTELAVDAARLVYRRAISDLLEGVIRDGIAASEFPEQDARASAACLVGAFMEGLVGPLAPESRDVSDTRALVEAIAVFCLQAVAGRRVRPLACPTAEMNA